MNKSGVDPKVKKTLVRNFEQKVRPTTRSKVVHDVVNATSGEEPAPIQTEKDFDQPTLCSSELLANYLNGVKNSLPPPSSLREHPSKSEICTKMTKKLNFNINDRMYKDLIELNANIDLKTRKPPRPSSSGHAKRDVEPNIEDFYNEEIDIDVAPSIPVIKPKFRPIRTVQDGQLHKLVATFENL